MLTNDLPSEFDPKRSPRIKRSYVENDGVISAESTLRPSVLPMTSLEADLLERVTWLVAVKTRSGLIRKGDLYQLKAVHQSGQLVVRGRDGADIHALFPMACFAQMVEENINVAPLPFDPSVTPPDGGSLPEEGSGPKGRKRSSEA